MGGWAGGLVGRQVSELVLASVCEHFGIMVFIFTCLCMHRGYI